MNLICSGKSEAFEMPVIEFYRNFKSCSGKEVLPTGKASSLTP